MTAPVNQRGLRWIFVRNWELFERKVIVKMASPAGGMGACQEEAVRFTIQETDLLCG